jgi:hypothetical protein
MAKKYLKQFIDKRKPEVPEPRVLKYETWAVAVHGVKQSCANLDRLYEAVAAPVVADYWKKKHGGTDDIHNKVCWAASRTAIRRMPLGLRRWQVKFSTGHCGVGKMLVIWKYQSHDKCPRCGAEGEDNIHVLQCPSPAAQTLWKDKLIPELKKTLTDLGSSATLKRTIVDIVDRWRQGKEIIPSRYLTFYGVRKAVQKQAQTLGWTNFMMGRWHTAWADAFDNAPWHRTKRSSKRWVTELVHKLFLTSWELWDQRNKILHAPGGPREIEDHARLDPEIRHYFELGSEPLRKGDKFLLRGKTLEDLLSMSVPNKENWLRLIKIAWEAYAAPTRLPTAAALKRAAQDAAQAAKLKAWLTQSQGQAS